MLPSGADRRQMVRWQFWTMLGFGLASLWMRTGFPILAVPEARYDDGLFLMQARSIGAGHWLGPFGAITLAKGSFYPAFIALTMALHLPLKTAEQTVYVLAALLACRVTERTQAGAPARVPATVLFALLCFNPTLWTSSLARVIRESLYIGQTLAILALCAALAVPDTTAAERRRLAMGAGLGLLAGTFWLNREEGAWLVPAVLAIVCLALPGSLRTWRSWAAAALAMLAMLGGVAMANRIVYGRFELNVFKSGPFLRAYGAISRIEPDAWQPYLLFPEDARRRAYAVSEAARELRPYLDGPAGAGWREPSCRQFHISPCTGTHAGWFLWELSEAVAAAGHYRTLGEANAFYDRLARELNAGCAAGKLPCLPPRATLMPPFRRRYVGAALAQVPKLLGMVLGRDGDLDTLPSDGSHSGLRDVADALGRVSPAGTTHLLLRGWAVAPSGAPTLSIARSDDGAADYTVTTWPAPDAITAHPRLHALRFEIDTDCPPASCALVLDAPDRAGAISVPLQGLSLGPAVQQGGAVLYLDQVARGHPAGWQGRSVQMRLARVLRPLYAALLPAAAAAAAAGLALALCSRAVWQERRLALVLACGCAVAVGCRVALLAWLQATSIPSANVLYASPASPAAIVFSVLGIWLGATALAGWWRRR